MINRLAAMLFAITLALLGLGIAATPASANAPCNSTNICFYPCYLNESCNPFINGPASGTTCYVTGATGLNNLTFSIKNNTSRQYAVYHTTNCTGTTAPVYAHSSGNMNSDWAGAGIKSFRKTSG